MKENSILGKISRMLTNIFNLSDKSSRQIIYSNAESADLSLDMSLREKAIYGEDNIKQQKLYEKWAVKTSWHLKKEAIPLLLSIDPEMHSNTSFDEAIEQKYQDLWEHAQHCVEQGLLLITNKEKPVDEWEATPVDVYKWAAISRVELPVQLTSLMEFIMMTLLSTATSNDSSTDENQSETSYNRDKELILGSALAMLAAYPEQCMNKKGRVRAEAIVSLINENEDKLFREKVPELSSTAAIDLVNKWLKLND